MSNKAETFCSSEKCGESFFCSSVTYKICSVSLRCTECSDTPAVFGDTSTPPKPIGACVGGRVGVHV